MNVFFSKSAIPNYGVWGVTLVSSYSAKIIDAGENRPLRYYFIIEGFLWFVFGVLLTFGVQFGLEKYTNGMLLKVKLGYLVFFMLTASVIFNFMFWPIIDSLHMYFLHRPSYHGKFATRIFNWLNWIIWFVCFTAFHLNIAVREAKIKYLSLEAEWKASQLNVLKGQINPHFMFNSLNNIRGLILEDTKKARKALTSLSEILRYSLQQNKITSITLERELELVKKYVDISKIHLEDRLSFTMDISKASLSITIPPMLVQMLIENAIKHGVSNLKEGGKVQLVANIKEGYLWVTVTNSGTLQQEIESTKIGLQNMEKRLYLMYGDRAFFSLEEWNKEVVATIKIPIQ